MKIVLVCAGTALLFFAVSGVVVFKTTSHSGFCNSCHIMEPYYQSWQRGKHKGVECTACHMPPHIKGKLLTKFEALSQLAKYVTRTYGTKPWGRIGDDSCTECHKVEDLIKKPVKPFKNGIAFSHAPHLAPEVRNRKLKCTTCHTQVDRNEHMEVLVSACYTCHFKPDDAGRLTRQSACTSCHADAAKHHKTEAVRAAAGADCTSCHKNVVRGDGEVPEFRCYQCHNSVGEVKKHFNDRDRLHEVHVSQKGVQCNNCHLEIVHQKPKKRAAPDASDCRQCHGASHEPQFELYSGALVRGGQPSGMFASGMQCASCHRPETATPKPSSCQPCHSARTEGLWAHWVDRPKEILAALKGTHKALTDDPATDPRARPELKAVEMRLAQLEAARPIHNLPQVRGIIDELDDRLRGVASPEQKAKIKPFAHRLWTESDKCLNCHFGVDKVKDFSHDVHVKEIPKKTCTACHQDGGAKHGAIADRKICASCHE